MFRLWQGRSVSRVVIAKTEVSFCILVMVSVHHFGFSQGEVNEFSKMKYRAIGELQVPFNKATRSGTWLNGERYNLGEPRGYDLFDILT